MLKRLFEYVRHRFTKKSDLRQEAYSMLKDLGMAPCEADSLLDFVTRELRTSYNQQSK